MALNWVPALPDEVLSMTCEELGRDKDFATLYSCARSCKSLADPALRILYQYHELSPAFVQNEEIDISQAQAGAGFNRKWKQAEQSFRKWTLIWRSIIMSSLDSTTTYKPYCRYLRILDFRNFAQLLEDPKFNNTIRRDFFKGGLEQFHLLIAEDRRQAIDQVATIDAVGEAVVSKTFMLEEIAGNLSAGLLTRWISRTPRLRSLVLFEGSALTEDAGTAIAERCEDFRSLTIRGWKGPSQDETAQADEACAQFLDNMNERNRISLEYFHIISFNEIQKASFLALGKHRNLEELRLGNLIPAAVENLNALKACTELHTLVLHSNLGSVQMNDEVFGDVVQWLSSCEKLRDLNLNNFYDGAAILAQVITAPTVRLTKLTLEGSNGYKVRQQSAAAFHTALSEQKTLEYLTLKGDGEDTTRNELAIMVEAISQLSNLRELELKEVSDEFDESHIVTLALSLPKLEEFWTGGDDVSANVLPALASLRNLKTLNMFALTQFSSSQIMEFLQSLDIERQKGFGLFLMAADPEWDLNEDEQEVIRDYIQQTLKGRFDFVLWRDPDESDSEDD